MSKEAQRCPICGHEMVTLGETAGEVALMCSYCTYNCVVLAGAGLVRPASGEETTA